MQVGVDGCVKYILLMKYVRTLLQLYHWIQSAFKYIRTVEPLCSGHLGVGFLS